MRIVEPPKVNNKKRQRHTPKVSYEEMVAEEKKQAKELEQWIRKNKAKLVKSRLKIKYRY